MSFDSTRSANSKRSFSNSASSNRSNDSTKTKKKKNTNQETLGVAWGSNSRSSSRSSFRKSPFSDFGSYMAEKNRKLHNQFDNEASNSSFGGSSSAKPIFIGVSIFVDGFTIPSSQELRSYMLTYGGRFENYFSRHNVTHIVCSNLSYSKVKNLRAFSAGLPVVKPSWILDSVAAGRLLSWVPYLLDQLASNQPKLSAFFTPKSSKRSEDAFTSPVEGDIEDSSVGVSQSEETYSTKVDNMVGFGKQTSIESDDILPEDINATTCEEPSSADNYCEVQLDPVIKDERDVQSELEPSHQGPAASASSYCLDDQNSKGCPSSTATGPSKQCHSTLVDPKFVENYFKSSRLHFIGTWRNRYRKCFPVLSTEFNPESSDVNAPVISGKKVIIHVDMDCFFVSVVIKDHPELLDKPVAVCHSNNSRGTAEISSANYPARSYGVRAGMFVRDAKALCPDLVIFPYNFEAYEEVADQFYSILHRRCHKVQAVSCDEAFLEVTVAEGEDPELLASSIREEIFETTRCTASAGIAGNMLMARIATKSAKPNGQYYISPEMADDHLCQLPISELPGIGHVLQEKLKKHNVHTCGELRIISKDSLQKDFGMKTGEMLWNYSRGIDNRLVGVIQESKSIGAEVNWGVRFNDMKECESFLINLCKEVALRLHGCGVQGRTFTLKIKKRKKDAEEPAKYMGCGDCENMSHSVKIPLATDCVDEIQSIAKRLFGLFHMDVKDIRGVGLQVSRLEAADASKKGTEKNFLRSWLASGSTSMRQKSSPLVHDNRNLGETSGQASRDSDGLSVQMDRNLMSDQVSSGQISTPPPLCHLDAEVVKSLPPEVFSELNEIYGGKLVDFLVKGKGKTESTSALGNLFVEQREAAMNKEQELPFSESNPESKIPTENKARQHKPKAIAASGSGAGAPGKVPNNSTFGQDDLMPSSLSQVDASVLKQLPEDLKTDILGQLPEHRSQAFCSNSVLTPLKENHLESSVNTSEHHPRSSDPVSNGNESLWVGNPPHWVHKFKVSDYLVLKKLAEVYEKSGAYNSFSFVLHQSMSEFRRLDPASESSDETINFMFELLKQYIESKIEKDIEEIYICIRLLRRFAAKSQFFLHVYDMVLPYLQEMPK
ncbi:DNA repair protein REV1 [Neltuma alba]|uniref:DNA repair protein REV1 n=1 Tax=Neltuma alba TaxID=207710 RepID=UPI0010A3439F|nr:DNA repair protein REV1-like [Prosopis alba]